MVLKKKLIKNNSLARVSCGFSHVFAEAAHRDEEGKVFYGNPTTGETSWEHPLEEPKPMGFCRFSPNIQDFEGNPWRFTDHLKDFPSFSTIFTNLLNLISMFCGRFLFLQRCRMWSGSWQGCAECASPCPDPCESVPLRTCAKPGRRWVMGWAMGRKGLVSWVSWVNSWGISGFFVLQSVRLDFWDWNTARIW